MAGIGQRDGFALGKDHEVAMFGKAVYQLGKMMPAPMLPNMLGDGQAVITSPQQMAQGGPRGTQEIPVIGMRPRNGGIRLAGRPQQPNQTTPMLGQRPAPAPQRLPAPAPATPPPPALNYALGAGEEAHTIEVRGLAPDGQEYVAKYDAVFPRGTRLLGAAEVSPG